VPRLESAAGDTPAPAPKPALSFGPAATTNPSPHIQSPAHSNGNGNGTYTNGHAHEHVAAVSQTAVIAKPDTALRDQIAEARLKGYEGESCPECGQFTMVRNGTCLKCASCGSTSGCS